MKKIVAFVVWRCEIDAQEETDGWTVVGSDANPYAASTSFRLVDIYPIGGFHVE